jgi:GT2 family glycosyltransferase
LYIGHRPVLENDNTLSIEINLFDFNDDIYGKNVQLVFHSFIRDDIEFTTIENLKTQLIEDEKVVRNYFNKNENLRNCAVVILNFNGLKYLEKFLSTLINFTTECDIIVADNASTDDSLKYLKHHYPEIRTIELEKNFGFAGGYNEAIANINHTYTLLLNSDVEVSENWVVPMITTLNNHIKVAACQPIIRAYNNKSQFEYAGAAGGMMDSLGYPFSRGRIFDSIEVDNGQYNTLNPNIAWTSGAAMLIRTELFKEFGGFDSDYFAHMEEIDLCWRLRNAGYELHIVPQSIVYHVGGGTLDYLNPKKTYLNFRNSLVTLCKNESISKLFWLFPLRLILDGIAGVKFLAELKWKHTFAIIKAHFYIYGNIIHILNKRKIEKEIKRKLSIGNPNKSGTITQSIVYQYYIKAVKKYSDLP